MAVSNARCKHDYEDLDESCTSINQKNSYITPLGAQPYFFQSDGALNTRQNNSENADIRNESFKPCSASSTPNFSHLHGGEQSSNRVTENNPRNMSVGKLSGLNCFCVPSKQNMWLICYVFFYTLFLVMGSYCIQRIETPIEQGLRQDYTEIRENFLQKYPLISDDLEEFVKSVISAHRRGISILEEFQNATNWDFGQSFFFSTTLVSTIGYGHITPKSPQGKIFCIAFASIGIPLTLVLFSALVARLLYPASYLLRILIGKYSCSHSILRIRLTHLGIIVTLVFLFFFTIPAIILSYLETTWTVLDAFYFCFISLTTIGLGDFVPGEAVFSEYDNLYKTLVSIYLLCGLVGMVLVLTVFYNIPQLNIGNLFTHDEESATEPYKIDRRSTRTDSIAF